MHMKKTLLLLLIFVTGVGNYLMGQPDWDKANQIVNSIRKTSFPQKFYNIVDFGAREGGHVLSTEAINKAIVTCNQNGGGIVLVPRGEFLTGPVLLKSNVNLHLEDGAVLKFATDPKLYMPSVLTRWEGVDCYNTSPLIYAYGESNIAITGSGIIDGQASNDTWWSWNGNPRFGWKEGIPSQKNGSRNRLLESAENLKPIAERIFTIEDALRPQMVNLYFCNTILIEGVTLKNSPFWMIHPLLCKDMIVRDVTIHNLGPNGDGCDPESCSNVLIEKCYFDTGDDCIAIKSGRNADGRKWNVPSENIVVRDCYMKNGHGGVVIGSEISGGFRNLFVENCKMDSPELDRVIRIKTNTCRGGVVENVYARNITVGQCKEAVLKINLEYEPNEDCDRNFPPTVKNVYLQNITSGKSKYGVLIIGLKDAVNVEHVSVKDCNFSNVEKEYSVSGAEDVNFSNLKINGKEVNLKE